MEGRRQVTYGSTFLYKANFPELTDAQIEAADAEVLVDWSGMFGLWRGLDTDLRNQKLALLENRLLAHHLAVNYPTEVVDAMSMGAIPLTGNSVGGVSLQYKDLEWVQGDMKTLMTTQWGVQALRQYQGAPERFSVLL
jgi:hypothetical protein